MEAALAGTPSALDARALLAAAAAGPHYGDRLAEAVCRIPCMTCGDLVLMVRLARRGAVRLEPHEVMPSGPCPDCRLIERRGHRRGGWCWRCGGTGVIGEVLPQPGIVVAPDGRARIYRGRRFVGDAVHRLHLCQALADAA